MGKFGSYEILAPIVRGRWRLSTLPRYTIVNPQKKRHTHTQPVHEDSAK